jgi:hypothetical protein
VAHIGKKLRFVLARLFKLTALVLDFVKQTHVLDGDACLIGERRGELNLPDRSTNGRPAWGSNEFFEGDGHILFEYACKLGCEGMVSRRAGSLYRSGRSPHWVKVKNPKAPAVTREADEDWGR